MTTDPSLDIIVPVWNSPAETQACLASILSSSTSARLILINNGCNRTTELMLEAFCEHLGDRAIYMGMERNIGFVPAINRALVRSDAHWALLVRPNTIITARCLQQIIQATTQERAGIILPHCPTESPLPTHLKKHVCTCIESSELNFSVLAISKIMREVIGLFDESLDGNIWCLKDYRQRANANDFRTYLLPSALMTTGTTIMLGSEERRRKQNELAAATFRQRWGEQHHFAVYLPKETDQQLLLDTLEYLLTGARNGNRFDLFLHQRQYRTAITEHNAACRHSNIILHGLSAFMPLRSLAKSMRQLTKQNPALRPVCGLDGTAFPGYDSLLTARTLQFQVKQYGGPNASDDCPTTAGTPTATQAG